MSHDCTWMLCGSFRMTPPRSRSFHHSPRNNRAQSCLPHGWSNVTNAAMLFQPFADHASQRPVLEILSKVLPRATGLSIVVMAADTIERQVERLDRPRHHV